MVCEGYPKSTLQGQAFEYVITNFHNKRALRYTSSLSLSDAKSKLRGFLVYMQAGHADFPLICQVSKCHMVPCAFKHYVSLTDQTPEKSLDVDMEDSSPTKRSSMSLLSRRKEWYQDVCSQPTPIKTFGKREVG